MTTEINTMSAAVDTCIQRCGRPDRKADIVSYLRLSIRECQTIKGALFDVDLIEDTVAANADPFIWEPGTKFRKMQTVRYPFFDDQGHRIYPKFCPPSKRQKNLDYFYYRSGTGWVFAGISGTAQATSDIDVAYFQFLSPLVYYAVAERPAQFILETDSWVYLSATTDAEKEAARNSVTNWLLSDWFDTIVEGGLAKLYKTTNDQRAAASYSFYKQSQDLIYTTVAMSAIGGEV